MLWYQKGSFGLVFFTALIIIGLSLISNTITNTASAIIMLIAFIFFMKKYGNNFKLNLQPKLPDKNGLALSILASILLAIIFISISLFFDRQITEFNALILIGTILFIITQELFWRGTLQKLFQCKINPEASIAITTALFTLSQTSTMLFVNAPGNMLFAMAEGIVLGAIIQKTNKVELAIITRTFAILMIHLLI